VHIKIFGEMERADEEAIIVLSQKSFRVIEENPERLQSEYSEFHPYPNCVPLECRSDILQLC